MKLTGLDGKIGLVTGASKGIGKSIAAVLAKSGVRVVCCARNEDTLSAACSEIEKNGGTALPVRADVSSPSDRSQLIERTISEFGGIDFLINNAGIHMEKDALELSDEEMLGVMEINFLPMFSLSRDVARQMIDRGGGKIINISSMMALRVLGKLTLYAMSKAAIGQMTKQLALEWARHDIQVNAICPGYIETEMNRDHWQTEAGQRQIAGMPRRRMPQPEVMDGLLLLLASGKSDYMTGTLIPLDDGQVLM